MAPAGIFGWPHETTPDAQARNLQAVTEAVRYCYNEGTKSYAKELGFKTDLDPFHSATTAFQSSLSVLPVLLAILSLYGDWCFSQNGFLAY